MDLTVLGEKLFIDAEELGEKKMFESLRTATDESLIAINHQIHTAGDLKVKKILCFLWFKSTIECMRPITHELMLRL